MKPGTAHGGVALLILLSAGSSWTAETTATKLPSKLDEYLTTIVRPNAAEYTRLKQGAPLTKLLNADPNLEVCVFGAIWIGAPMRRYVEAVEDIESFERGGGFRLTKRISSPPRVEDFTGMELSEEDVTDLRTCRVGDCEIKLGEQALERIRAEIDWNAPNPRAAASALMRRLALDYVNAYLEGGNDRLAVYRDNSRPTFVAREFRSMIEQMPALTTYMPNVRRYLLDYPRAALPNSKSFLYWQETRFGLKPTVRISHLVIQERPEDTVVASKMLYASHYFWTAVELRALVPDPSRGGGFWYVTVSRSRSDGLSGFTGRLIRRRVRSETEEATLAALRSVKRKLEQAQ